MNEILNKFLLRGDKFMPEMHLEQPRFPKILKSLERKSNKIRNDQGSEFYNTSFKRWLKDNEIEIQENLLLLEH